MHLGSKVTLFLSIAITVLADPYQYSYYIYLPGHYQGLEINNGAAKTDNSYRLARNFQRWIGIDRKQPDVNVTMPPNNINQTDDIDIPDEQLDPFFNQESKFGTKIPSTTPSATPTTSTTQSSTNTVPTETPGRDKEEVTTVKPCDFCGIDRVNPNGHKLNPDAEPVVPKNVNPPTLLPNTVLTPTNVILPAGFSISNPPITYYVVRPL